MINVLYNALHLIGNYSGVQYTIEGLMKEALKNPVSDIHLEALCPYCYKTDIKIHSSQKLTNLSINTLIRIKRIGYEHFFLKQYFSKNNKNILHCPGYILPFNWPNLSVVTVHDIIALEYPKYCSLENSLYFKIFLPNSIKKSTKIITFTNTVKNDILNRFDINPDKIEVIYPGIKEIYRQKQSSEFLEKVKFNFNLPDKFILFIGNLEPKKNIVRLIRAFRLLIKKTNYPHYLVIVGQFGWKYKELLKELDKNSDRIICIGYINQCFLPAMYTLADLFIFPSLYEGFGIPPIEAMACGTPVVSSDKGALKEIVGNHAFIVDPLSEESIMSGICHVLSNSSLREQLINRGKIHTKQFNWQRSWANTVKLYHSMF